MNQNLQTVIAKIQKLLALSQSANPNEAATAAAIANKLIDQYRLSSDDFQSSDNADSDPLVDDDSYIYESGRITRWRSHLVMMLSKHYGCACFNDITHKPEGRKVSRYKLVGRKSDIEVTRYMFTWLSAECERLTLSEARGKGHTFSHSYSLGFVMGIADQLAISRKEAESTASSTAIIHMNARYDEANDFMTNKRILKATKSRSSSHIDGGAYDSGRVRGANTHLGSAMGSGGKMKLLNG